MSKIFHCLPVSHRLLRALTCNVLLLTRLGAAPGGRAPMLPRRFSGLMAQRPARRGHLGGSPRRCRSQGLPSSPVSLIPSPRTWAVMFTVLRRGLNEMGWRERAHPSFCCTATPPSELPLSWSPSLGARTGHALWSSFLLGDEGRPDPVPCPQPRLPWPPPSPWQTLLSLGFQPGSSRQPSSQPAAPGLAALKPAFVK